MTAPAETAAGGVTEARSRDEIDGALFALGAIVSDLPTGASRSAGQRALGLLSIADSIWRFRADAQRQAHADEVERLTCERDAAQGSAQEQRHRAQDAEAQAMAAEADAAALRAENDQLRGLLAMSNAPCPYCGLAAVDMAKCAHGFPGCARADDMLADPGAAGVEFPSDGDATGDKHDIPAGWGDPAEEPDHG